MINYLYNIEDKKTMSKYKKIVAKANELEYDYKSMSDEDLKGLTDYFRQYIRTHNGVNDLLPQILAGIREAGKRTLGIRLHDVQLIGALSLNDGRITEMMTGEGKALPDDLLIPTPTGFRYVGDIKVGDLLFDHMGRPTKVTGVFPQKKKKQVYEVVLKDKRVIPCCIDHLFTVYDFKNRKKVMSVGDMLPDFKMSKGYRYKLPMCGEVEYDKQEFILDPYIMGYLIGKSRKGPFLETNITDDAVLKYFEEKLNAKADVRGNYCRFIKDGKSLKYSDIGFDMGDLSINSKYIPSKYLMGSVEQRWQLLKGLMDSDGHISRVDTDYVRYHLRYHSSSIAVVKGLIELIHSLGLSANYSRLCKHRKDINYVVRITVSNEVKEKFFEFSSKKKLAKQAVEVESNVCHDFMSIVDIRETNRKTNMTCFTVDNEEHLFLANDYIVTHNTVTAIPALYINALGGLGAHLVTVNDYLAKRDSKEVSKLFNFMGLSVGCITNGMNQSERKKAYACDVTYGTNNEFGFDYLRDNMAIDKSRQVQRGHNFVIVDEVDSILIDEARTPLIISGAGDKSNKLYLDVDVFVRGLKYHIDATKSDVEIDEKDKACSLTEQGVMKAQKYFNIDNLSDLNHTELHHHINQSLRAYFIMNKNIDYVVKNNEVIIVDEFTGRLMNGRRYSDGLHQAIEAKEGVTVQDESKTLSTITFQNYFRLYNKLSGMTGTAKTEEEEFRSIYYTDVFQVPTNKPVIRQDLRDLIFIDEESKFNAIVQAVESCYKKGQPVLVGTTSVDKSEKLSEMLTKVGIKHNVLNAKNHEKEAEIVAQAGRIRAVTIATNMAGRGTDIILGGNARFLTLRELKKQGFSDELISKLDMGLDTKDIDEELKVCREYYEKEYAKYKHMVDEEREEVVRLGGLFVIGSERHESRRIDNQLKGRSGRQGDPGKSRFYLSFEDDLLRLFGGERQAKLARTMAPGHAFGGRIYDKTVLGAQQKIEGKNFGIRKSVLDYDDVMNTHRQIIYKERQLALDGEDLSKKIKTVIQEVISDFYEKHKDLCFKDFSHKLNREFGIKIEDTSGFLPNAVVSKDLLLHKLFEQLEEKRERLGDRMNELERAVVLSSIDTYWTDHIDLMDQLKKGIGLRAFGQIDPVGAYRVEAYDMYEEMNKHIREMIVKLMFHVDDRTEMVKSEPEVKLNHVDTTEEIVKPSVGRNEMCPCGSGKKYKKCCGR